MILYLDTSSLVKLYVDEDGSEAVRSLVDDALLVSTSVIAYPEARSAFARLRRESLLSRADLTNLLESFEEDWDHLLTLEVTESIWRGAGELAQHHGLKGFDSLHLASYRSLAALDLTQETRFSCHDRALERAAETVDESESHVTAGHQSEEGTAG